MLMINMPSGATKCGASQCLCDAITSGVESGSSCCGCRNGPSISTTREIEMLPTARFFIPSYYFGYLGLDAARLLNNLADPASAGACPQTMGSPAASGAITAPPPRFEHSASLATAASARRVLRSRPVRRERRDTPCRSLREAAAVGARGCDEHR